MKKLRGKMVALMLTIVFGVLTIGTAVQAASLFPNNVTTYIGTTLVGNVDVNFNAEIIQGLIGRSYLSDFWKAAGMTSEDADKGYKPVVYVAQTSLSDADANLLRAKATEIGAEQIVTFIDIFLFRETTESTFISSYPNYVEYTIKLPSSLDSSEMEYAMISLYDGKMQLFKDSDSDYTLLTFKTNKSAPYALVRAWAGTFDDIENGAYIDDLSALSASTDDELDDVPKTGENNLLICLIYSFAALAIISGISYVLIERKERIN